MEYWIFEHPHLYQDAYNLQRSLTAEGKKGWILFHPSPVITVGRNADLKEVILIPSAGYGDGGDIPTLSVDRGGQGTYHGPGQIVGFPVGMLTDFTSSSRGVKDFVRTLQKNLKEFLREDLNLQEDWADDYCSSEAGIWIRRQGSVVKLVSFGFRFSKEGISHGFAVNIDSRVKSGFEKIIACGDAAIVAEGVYPHVLDASSFQKIFTQLKNRFYLHYSF